MTEPLLVLGASFVGSALVTLGRQYRNLDAEERRDLRAVLTPWPWR